MRAVYACLAAGRRRRAPLPDVDLDEVRLRTVMADNLPEKPSIGEPLPLERWL